jgi:hypothetical protein
MNVAENIDSEDPIRYCISVILKEARMEDRLVRQLLYVMFSAYTNNPINLAINSPSGEGKNWVIRHVAEKFPDDDVIRLTGMTAKSIFHKRGTFVVKDEETGQYETLENLTADIDSEIWKKEQDILMTQDKSTKSGLKAAIRDLEHDKSELRARAKS